MRERDQERTRTAGASPSRTRSRRHRSGVEEVFGGAAASRAQTSARELNRRGAPFVGIDRLLQPRPQPLAAAVE